MATTSTPSKPSGKKLANLQRVTIRFAGDSGDGMQLTGTQFSDATALAGNDLSTLPDYPAEIRAPAGTVAGVSGYQVQFASHEIYTPGDKLDTLVAMNPAALKRNLADVSTSGNLIINTDAFVPADLKKAGYEGNPLEGDALAAYRVYPVPMNRLTQEAVAGLGLSPRDAERCKNMFALGLVSWLYDRPLEPTLAYIKSKFGKKPAIAQANANALHAGYNFGETSEMFQVRYQVAKANLTPGAYRKVTGNQAAALAMVAAARLAGKQLYYASYPITPATEILQELSGMKGMGVVTFQAEDEIAAMGSVVGAAFGGALAATATSGPGMALKSEAIGLGVMVELPMVIVNVQRGGPSTGLPTKTEQSDLFQAIMGRHGECPVVVVAPATPSDCFAVTLEAFRIAVRLMVPVIVLSDGYLGQGAEPWLIPDVAKLPPIPVEHPTNPEGFQPYKRNADLVRPWAIPGTPGLQHRVGGLEKKDGPGGVSHDPLNHQRMCQLRADKVARARMAEPYRWLGDDQGDLLLVGWGSSYGSIIVAVEQARAAGQSVSCCHLRQVNPLPEGLGEKFKRFKKILVPEMNLGQLSMILRARYLIDAKSWNKVRGQPFTVSDIAEGIQTAQHEGAPRNTK